MNVLKDFTGDLTCTNHLGRCGGEQKPATRGPLRQNHPSSCRESSLSPAPALPGLHIIWGDEFYPKDMSSPQIRHALANAQRTYVQHSHLPSSLPLPAYQTRSRKAPPQGHGQSTSQPKYRTSGGRGPAGWYSSSKAKSR